MKENDKNKLVDELSFNNENSIPPGYRDKKKIDKGIGDFMLWKTILEIGEKEKKDIILVSNDQKNDWWHRNNNQPFYPRFELVYQFKQKSEDKNFHIIKLSKLLDIMGVSDDLIKEIRSSENKPTTINKIVYGYSIDKIEELIIEFFNNHDDRNLIPSINNYYDFKSQNNIKQVFYTYKFYGDLSNFNDTLDEDVELMVKSLEIKKIDTIYYLIIVPKFMDAFSLSNKKIKLSSGLEIDFRGRLFLFIFYIDNGELKLIIRHDF